MNRKDMNDMISDRFLRQDLEEIIEDCDLEVPTKKKKPLKKDFVKALSKELYETEDFGKRLDYRLINRIYIKEIADIVALYTAIEDEVENSVFNHLLHLDIEKRTYKESIEIIDDFCAKNLKLMPAKQNINAKQTNSHHLLYEMLTEPMSEIDKIISVAKINKDRVKNGLPSFSINLNCIFTGEPGTGKTVTSHKFAEDLHKEGIVKSPKVAMLSSSDLKGEYLGQSGPKTKKALESNRGRVIMVDEAYSIMQDKDSYSDEVMAQLLICAEEMRYDTAIILCGYKNQMEKTLNSNPGLRSRFRNVINFKSYTNQELKLILEDLLDQYKMKINFDYETSLYQFINKLRKAENFGNAREIRNLFEELIKAQGARLIKQMGDLSIITKSDFDQAINKFDSSIKNENRVGL